MVMMGITLPISQWEDCNVDCNGKPSCRLPDISSTAQFT